MNCFLKCMMISLVIFISGCNNNGKKIEEAEKLAQRYEEILGKTASQDIEEATPLSWDLVEGNKI